MMHTIIVRRHGPTDRRVPAHDALEKRHSKQVHAMKQLLAGPLFEMNAGDEHVRRLQMEVAECFPTKAGGLPIIFPLQK